MQILMISPQPFFQPRGTPFSILWRLKALASLGYKIDLLTYHLGQEIDLEGVRIFRIPKIPFIKNIKIGPSWSKIFLDLFIFIKAIFMLCKKRYDVIHSHEEAGFMSIILATIFKTKHIYDMHSSLPQQLKNFNRFNYKVFYKLFKILERLTINKSDAIITICPDLRNYVSKINSQKFHILIENIPEDSMGLAGGSPAVSRLKEQYSLNNKSVVLYTGTFEPYQGLEMLIDGIPLVAQEFPGKVVFVLVGGTETQVASLRERAIKNQVEEYVLFTGTVPPEDIPYYLEIAHILVSPRIEGSNTPLKIYSYLRSGKPIIATNLYTHTQVLNPEVALLVEPTKDAFAQGIIHLLRDSKLRDKLANNAAQLAHERYSYGEYLRRTEEIYHTLQTK
jgi:glycosyltransferase involved in cell wall biosynthesis